MKYLKYFESSTSDRNEIVDNKEDIIRVLTKYSKEYDDTVTQNINEFIWNSPASDRFDEVEEVDEECIRILVDDFIDNRFIMTGTGSSNLQRFIEIYYDCREVINAENGDIIQDLNDIFADYDSMGTFRISKSSDRNDNRYSIDINIDNILKKLDFIEIVNRVESITGFHKISYSGTKDQMTIEFYKESEKDD